MSEHTLGPWRHNSISGVPACAVWTDGGEYPIAVLNLSVGSHRPVPPEQMDANARLISAAPDMFAVLKAVEWAGTEYDNAGEHFVCCPSCCHRKRPLNKHGDGCELAAAIAKATATTTEHT